MLKKHIGFPLYFHFWISASKFMHIYYFVVLCTLLKTKPASLYVLKGLNVEGNKKGTNPQKCKERAAVQSPFFLY